jgi:DNA-binding GntR family transcriptional regulator
MATDSSNKIMRIKPPKSISDQIYEFLKKQILSGDLTSGARLLGKDVAERLNTSRTPVREAFRCLEHDGLVERLPQGGVKVKKITREEIHEFFDIRRIMEVYAVEMACDRISVKEIGELEKIESEAQALLDEISMDRKEKIQGLIELNSRFHEIIYGTAGNKHLIRIIHDLKAIAMRMRAMGLREDSSWVQVWKEHSQLLAFIKKGDKTAAVALIRRHLANAASYVVATAGRLVQEEKTPQVF